jgi:hypothetical protein
MPASHLQPITEVAKPVSERPASSAQAGVAAVITARAPHMGNASAKVSSISAPCSFKRGPQSWGCAATVCAGSSSHGSRTG